MVERIGRGGVRAAGLMTLALIIAGAARIGCAAAAGSSKAELTPAFWQRDPQADFDDEGRMHCAPTAVSDGLIYLATAFDFNDLVPGTDHDAQMELIEELAEDFDTDPSAGGTTPDKILTGLQTYVNGKGYKLSRLELKSWRDVSAGNKEFVLNKKPDLTWMRAAVRKAETVVLFNFGWYYEEGDGYTRKGGHWVAVVDAGTGTEFDVRNPFLQADKQTEESAVELSLIDVDFEANIDNRATNMKGYYEGDGTGLPHGEKVKAILDGVIVFSVAKGE